MTATAKLQLFVRIAARQSLSRAAADLDIPQSTATRWLADLETEYGTELVARSTRRLRLTDAGAKFLDHARDVIERDHAIRAAFAGESRTPTSRLKIGASSSFGSVVLLPALAEFRAAHPNLVVDLKLTDTFVDLIAEGLDLAIRIGALEDSRLVAKRLGTLDEVMVCRADLTKRLDRDNPADVERLPWIRLSVLQHGPHVTIASRTARRTIQVQPWLWLDNAAALKHALLAGAGATLIHRYAVARELAAGTLVQLLPQWRLPSWPVSAVRAAGRVDPRVAAFSAHLKTVVAAL